MAISLDSACKQSGGIGQSFRHSRAHSAPIRDGDCGGRKAEKIAEGRFRKRTATRDVGQLGILQEREEIHGRVGLEQNNAAVGSDAEIHPEEVERDALSHLLEDVADFTGKAFSGSANSCRPSSISSRFASMKRLRSLAWTFQ